MTPEPERFLDFWFDSSRQSPTAARKRQGFWFEASEEVDRACARFAGWLAAAEAGELDGWARAPRSCLALVLLLDQLPRNLHRGTPAAFANDARALALADRALETGWNAGLAVLEEAFLLMPYQHAEDLDAQRRGAAHYRALVERVPEVWKTVASGYRDFARKHEEIIERFGRFPHRNALLARAPTPEEERWLAEGGARFGQG